MRSLTGSLRMLGSTAKMGPRRKVVGILGGGPVGFLLSSLLDQYGKRNATTLLRGSAVETMQYIAVQRGQLSKLITRGR